MENGHLQFVAAAVVLLALLGGCGGREVRPSDHGLDFQEASSPPPRNGEAEEMRSFFGAAAVQVQLPEAKNISDTWLSSQAGGGRAPPDAGRDHVRLALLAASAACALIGVVLLAVSGVVFLHRLRRRGRKPELVSSTSALTALAPVHAELNTSTTKTSG